MTKEEWKRFKNLKEYTNTLYKGLRSGYHTNENGRYMNFKNSHNLIYDKTLFKNEKFITFIMPLRNRRLRALYSLYSIVNEINSKDCNFIIVEDNSIKKEELEIPNELKNFISHYKIDTGDGQDFNRGKILNYGINKANTELCLMWDSDFIFPNNFIYNLKKILQVLDYRKQFFAIPSHETHGGVIRDAHYRNGDIYGRLWVYNTNILKSIKGFNENITNHGMEEKELQKRLMNLYNMKKVETRNINPELLVFHYTHSDVLRAKDGYFTNKKYVENIEENKTWLKNIKLINKK